MQHRVYLANPSAALEVPEEMRGPTLEVLNGEYEAGFSGSQLTILDIGANVGAFSWWANGRWPGSVIHAYEPHPETFAMLVRNTRSLPNVICHHAAIYPSEKADEPFYSKYAGAGEAGLVAYMSKMFQALPERNIVTVPVVHPRTMPRCDVIKIDTEGAEVEILSHIDCDSVSLVLVRYHHLEDKRRIKEMLDDRFQLDFEADFEWEPLLGETEYRRDLAGDFYGNLWFVNKKANKLARESAPDSGSRRSLVGASAGVEPRTLDRISPMSSSASGGQNHSTTRSEGELSQLARNRPVGIWLRLMYSRDLLRELVSRDMKLRYKRSVLGFAWSLLNPLAQLFVLSLVFRLILPLNIPNYPSFLFTGLLAWNWFSSALYQATDAIVANRDLVRYPGFPDAILPIVTVMSHLLHFVLALPILALFLTLSGIHMTSAVLFLPLVMALQFALTLALAYLVATFYVSFRDTQYLLGIVLMLGFYLTPIFYEASALPQRYQTLYRLNPMVHLVEAYRSIFMHGKPPDLSILSALGVATAVLLYLGYRVFAWASVQFAEEL